MEGLHSSTSRDAKKSRFNSDQNINSLLHKCVSAGLKCWQIVVSKLASKKLFVTEEVMWRRFIQADRNTQTNQSSFRIIKYIRSCTNVFLHARNIANIAGDQTLEARTQYGVTCTISGFFALMCAKDNWQCF